MLFIENWIEGIFHITYKRNYSSSILHYLPKENFSNEQVSFILKSSYPKCQQIPPTEQLFNYVVNKNQVDLFATVLYSPDKFIINKSDQTQENKKEKEKEKVTQKQQKTKTIKTGNSIIILSKYRFHELFNSVLQELKLKMINHDPNNQEYGIEQCFLEIQKNWPKQLRKNQVQTRMGINSTQRLRVFIPGKSGSIFSTSAPIICSKKFSGLSADLYSLFKPFLPHLWKIWQLLITGESLVITSQNPDLCSFATWEIPTLIYPLEYGGKILPYTNIYSKQFFKKIEKKHLKNNQEEPWVIGSSNIQQSLQLFSKWQNILILNPSNHQILKSKNNINKERKKERGKKQENMKEAINVGLKSDLHLLIPIDKKILSKFQSFTKKINKNKNKKKSHTDQQVSLNYSKCIRKYFYHLTKQFILPLENYFNQLIPDITAISPFYQLPVLHGFSENQFLDKLFRSELGRDFQGKYTETEQILYRKFIHSPTFLLWYYSKKKEVSNLFSKLYRESIFQVNSEYLIKGKNEIQLIDLTLRIFKKLETSLIVKDFELCDVLMNLINEIIPKIPKQYQINLMNNYKKFQQTIEKAKNSISESLKKVNNQSQSINFDNQTPVEKIITNNQPKNKNKNNENSNKKNSSVYEKKK
ncbi:hypothetical protein M0813_09626 [Anaeramoeba flamelloides]|uniref:UDENN domain-containing protein n=1 Tax=Anaeramoeba flamelloides TaxID=1746091 RepID=A0ABQ8X4Y5_9EUKA|nr:hypothetical protein M0813_09626 [Anaeramoeba flamelloides]